MDGLNYMKPPSKLIAWCLTSIERRKKNYNFVTIQCEMFTLMSIEEEEEEEKTHIN